MIGPFLLRNPGLANRLYGFTPPETGTVVLAHRRVYIVPARMGLAFGLVLGVLLVGSINYVLALGFALTFLLAGMALSGMVHTARNLARLEVSAGRSKAAFAGQAAHFRLLIDNRAEYDRPAILVRHVASGVHHVVDLGGHASVEVGLDLPAPKRGWLPLGRVMLETRFPLGLFRAWSYVELDARCLVYPRPEPSPLPGYTSAASSEGARRHAAGSEDFAGLRPWNTSDSPRHVAWKALARSDEMLTKQFSGTFSTELWLDWRALPDGLEIERRLSRLTAWALDAERSGLRYGLRLPGLEIQPGRGEEHCAACLRALALHDTDAAAP